MRAVQAIAFGAPSVLEVTELPDPVPGPGEVAINVTHSAVGLIDVFFRQGLYRDRPGTPRPPFVPGLEVAGTVRAVGDGVTGLTLGERVVSMSGGSGTGGYAAVYVAPARGVALTSVAHLEAGESVLVHGALGGFVAAFPGMARQLGASRVIGSVRASKLDAARNTRLPYDRIVDSAELPGALDGETFDVIIDPVGGDVRTHSLALMRPGSRLIVAGNASGDWQHAIPSNEIWGGGITVAGFNAGAFLPTHPDAFAPALRAAVDMVAGGLAETAIDVIPFDEAARAHERMESRELEGRLVLGW
jgi:NADPH2:quinone reductase